MAVDVLTVGYRGSLFSFLLAPQYKPPIESIAEAVNSPLKVQSFGKKTLNILLEINFVQITVHLKN